MAEIKLTIERKGNNLARFQEFVSALEDEIRDIGSEIEDEFEATTKNWETSPEFRQEYQRNAKYIRTQVKPKGKGATQYARVSQGTRPHLIRPKRKKRLSFLTGYVPHTKPGGSVGGPGAYTGPRKYSKAVQHPGSDARNFNLFIIQKKAGEWISQVVQLAHKKLQ